MVDKKRLKKRCGWACGTAGTNGKKSKFLERNLNIIPEVMVTLITRKVGWGCIPFIIRKKVVNV